MQVRQAAARGDAVAARRCRDFAQHTFADKSDEQRKAVTALGLEYNLLTEYTSFIAVTDEVRLQGQRAQKVDQPLPVPAQVEDSAIEGGFGPRQLRLATHVVRRECPDDWKVSARL